MDVEKEILDIEGKLLDAVESAWDAYINGGGGMMPPMLLALLEKTHKILSHSIISKGGGSFDMTKPEETLLRIKNIERLLVDQIEKRKHLRLVAGSK